MNEIMEKTFELIDVLDNSKLMREMEMYKMKIISDEEIIDLVKKGNVATDEKEFMEIKKKLYDNDDYRGYMERYNELLKVVRDINFRYKKLLGKGRCF